MEQLFDFDRIRELLTAGSLSLCFDAMNAITGPYAREILENRLGAPGGTVHQRHRRREDHQPRAGRRHAPAQVHLDEVASELARREGTSGLVEKASREK